MRRSAWNSSDVGNAQLLASLRRGCARGNARRTLEAATVAVLASLAAIWGADALRTFGALEYARACLVLGAGAGLFAGINHAHQRWLTPPALASSLDRERHTHGLFATALYLLRTRADTDANEPGLRAFVLHQAVVELREHPPTVSRLRVPWIAWACAGLCTCLAALPRTRDLARFGPAPVEPAFFEPARLKPAPLEVLRPPGHHAPRLNVSDAAVTHLPTTLAGKRRANSCRASPNCAVPTGVGGLSLASTRESTAPSRLGVRPAHDSISDLAAGDDARAGRARSGPDPRLALRRPPPPGHATPRGHSMPRRSENSPQSEPRRHSAPSPARPTSTPDSPPRSEYLPNYGQPHRLTAPISRTHEVRSQRVRSRGKGAARGVTLGSDLAPAGQVGVSQYAATDAPQTSPTPTAPTYMPLEGIPLRRRAYLRNYFDALYSPNQAGT